MCNTDVKQVDSEVLGVYKCRDFLPIAQRWLAAAALGRLLYPERAKNGHEGTRAR